MTRAEAEVERERLSREHPDATWLIREENDGGWVVVRIGLAPPDKKRVETSEERPRPPQPDDPMGSTRRNFSTWGAN